MTKFKTFYLANDIKMDNAGHTLESLFNGDHGLNSWNYAHGYDFNPSEFPVWFTFDMGQTAQLSRFTSWQRSMGGSYYYRAGAIKEWKYGDVLIYHLRRKLGRMDQTGRL